MTNAMNALGARTYLITAGALFPVSDFEYFLKTDPHVLAYWNYLPGIYFVKSRASAQQLTLAVERLFAGLNYIVIQVNHFDMNGKLQKDAWQWFYEQPNAMARALNQPPPRNPFGTT